MKYDTHKKKFKVILSKTDLNLIKFLKRYFYLINAMLMKVTFFLLSLNMKNYFVFSVTNKYLILFFLVYFNRINNFVADRDVHFLTIWLSLDSHVCYAVTCREWCVDFISLQQPLWNLLIRFFVNRPNNFLLLFSQVRNHACSSPYRTTVYYT